MLLSCLNKRHRSQKIAVKIGDKWRLYNELCQPLTNLRAGSRWSRKRAQNREAKPRDRKKVTFLADSFLPDRFSLIVRRHSSTFQANCALFDASMKFGTLIAVTNTSIFRYSAKLEVLWFPWKPQFMKNLWNPSVYPSFFLKKFSKYFNFNSSNLFTKFVLFWYVVRCP